MVPADCGFIDSKKLQEIMKKHNIDPNRQNINEMTSILKDEDIDVLKSFAQFVENIETMTVSDADTLKSLKSRIENGKLYQKIMQKLKLNLNDFELLKVLGQGAFGKVLLAEHKTTSTTCAIKVLSKRDVVENDSVDLTMVERRILELGNISMK